MRTTPHSHTLFESVKLYQEYQLELEIQTGEYRGQ